jgi:hypothetical protein
MEFFANLQVKAARKPADLFSDRNKSVCGRHSVEVVANVFYSVPIALVGSATLPREWRCATSLDSAHDVLRETASALNPGVMV